MIFFKPRQQAVRLSVGCACAILQFVIPVHAAEYYVAVGGSNAAAGTAAAPWATLQHAANVVGAGDRVTVRAGAYAGFYLETSGSASNPIEFRAEPGVLITQRNATTPDGINLEAASNVIIDGFAVTGMPRAGVRAAALPEAGMNHVTIRNVYAYDNARWGIFTGFVDDLLIENNRTTGSMIEHGIYVSNSGDRPVLRGNISWNNHGAGIHMNGDESEGGDGIISGALVSGNWIFNNAVNGGGGSGINMDGVQNSRIENNLVYGNHASGISLYREDGGGGSTGNVVVNNTVRQASDGRWALNIQGGSTGNRVFNNILLNDNASRGAIDISSDSLPGLVSDYNIVEPRFKTEEDGEVLDLDQWRLATGQDNHSAVSTAAALFLNPAGGDYHLKAGAAAINAGTGTLAPGVDLSGVGRPMGAMIDIGAFEFGLAGADFNASGAVNAADFTNWRGGFGVVAGAKHVQGDANGDGGVDGTDFLIWQRQLGSNFAAEAAAGAAPEPAAGIMAILAAAALAAVQSRGRLQAIL